MKAKYSKKRYIYFQFDLQADKELGFAYFFLHGANQQAKPLGEVGEKLRAMEEALKWDIIEKNEREIDSAHFSLCAKCTGEIDLRLGGHTVDEVGNHYHAKCPTMPDTEL